MKTQHILSALVAAVVVTTSVRHQTFAQIAGAQPQTPLAASAPTAVPSLVPYSGAAIASDGKPLSGEIGITFQIYKDEQGGEALWTETQNVTLDPAGRYKVELGATSASGLPADLFAAGEARWLTAQIAGQPPQPRALIASVPYALKAGDATTLGGLPLSAFALAESKGPASSGIAVPAGVGPNAVSNVTTTGGTEGYLPVFVGTASVVDSIIFQNNTAIGIGTTSPAAKLDVNGSEIVAGTLSLPAIGTSTTSAGSSSEALSFTASSFNTSANLPVPQTFEWQAVPVGNDTANAAASLDLLFGKGTATPAATGLAIASNGKITFAPGQTFPGTADGTITGVTAGYDLLGGGTSGTVVLNLNTGATDSRYARLAAANAFAGNQTITGNVSATSFSGNGAGLTGVSAANSAELGGLAPAAFAELAANNTFSGIQDFTKVGIGTPAPRSLLEIQASARQALGPVATLTNTLGGQGAESALDFNTIQPSTTGTYNPMARIVAQDADSYSDNLLFQSNNPTPSAPNSGLVTNMTITSTGQVLVNPSAFTYYYAQLNVAGTAPGTTGIYTTGSAATPLSYASDGISAGGGDDTQGSLGGRGGAFSGGDSTTGNGGAGGLFVGGDSNTGEGGDGIDVGGGNNNSTTVPAGEGIFVGGGESDIAQALAGYFQGDVVVNGTLNASLKNFQIDHPLDPANKYLVHSSVESSEMMNIYSGNVTTDELGLATIALPDWFEVENTDFRYQLTTIGRDAHAWIAQKVKGGKFQIATNATNVEVSWQITAVRQDAWAKAHPLIVELEKPARERGYYVHPELYGQPAEKQTEWGRYPQRMQRMKEMREKRRPIAERPSASALTHGQPAGIGNKRPAAPEAAAVNQPPGHAELRPTGSSASNN